MNLIVRIIYFLILSVIAFMFCFGVFGAAVGMRVFHHKTNKPLFQGSLTLALVLHIVLIGYVVYLVI